MTHFGSGIGAPPSVDSTLNVNTGFFFTGDATMAAIDRSGEGIDINIRGGHSIGQGDGGTVDLIPGNGAGTGTKGSIGVGRTGAFIVTIGKLDDPEPTFQTFVRARTVLINGRQQVNVVAPELVFRAIKTRVQDDDSSAVASIEVPAGNAFLAQNNLTQISFASVPQIQAYSGGLIIQKQATGKLAHYDGNPVVQPIITASKSDALALANALLVALKAVNLVKDSSLP